MIHKIMFVIVFYFIFETMTADAPKFRILAPPFVCPKDKETVIDKPDNTVVTLQTEAGLDVKFRWTVRWYPLDAPSQRFTLALWRTVRNLEHKLNGLQAEPGVYVIDNKELLPGVNYMFNVTGSSLASDQVTDKVFHIDNIKGDQTLLIEGRSEMFAVLLVGGQLTFADIVFVVEAQVTMCYRSQDYYFAWTIEFSSGNHVNVSHVKGSRLEVPAHTMTAGLSYTVLCQVYKISTGEFITENSLPFQVLHRELEVHFNIDVLGVTINTPFSLLTNVDSLDCPKEELTTSWQFTHDGVNFGESVDIEQNVHGILTFPSGLPDVGEYLISITVGVLGDTAEAAVRVITYAARLPQLQVDLTPRLLNEGSTLQLNANVSNMTPGCSVSWYFLALECLSMNSTENCLETEHGKLASEQLYFFSLEEGFLSELTDYTNETSWKSVQVELSAPGRARAVVECSCTLYNCTAEGVVYADVNIEVNSKPDEREVLVSPDTGTAMETVFRISTLAVVDPNRPLRYTFFCSLGNDDDLILGSLLEHLAVETMLPYVEGGTNVWVEICDSLGACSSGHPKVVLLLPGEAKTIDTMVEEVVGYVSRCDLLMLQRQAIATIVTYTNTNQAQALTSFKSALLASLQGIDKTCTEMNYDLYSAFLLRLSENGIDINSFIEENEVKEK